MELTKEYLDSVEKIDKLFGRKFIYNVSLLEKMDLQRVLKIINNNYSIYRNDEFIDNLLTDNEVTFLSYNKETDIIRLYAESRCIFIKLKYNEWNILKVSFDVTCFADNYRNGLTTPDLYDTI